MIKPARLGVAAVAEVTVSTDGDATWAQAEFT